MNKTLTVYVGGHYPCYVSERIERLAEMLRPERVVTIKRGIPTIPFWCHIFEHDGIYKVWDCADNCNPNVWFAQKFFRDPLCQFILKCQMQPDSPLKFRPFFYFARSGKLFDDQIDGLRELPKKNNHLYWRGNFFRKRGKLLRGDRKEVVSKISHLLNKDHQNRVNKNVFCREIAQARMALSLPGLGKACHREFEAFAVGTPVIMPEYTNVYHVNLVPDRHYISVVPREEESMSEAIERRYLEVKDDEDFLKDVSDNAIDYYDKYCRIDASVKWLEKLLEL